MRTLAFILFLLVTDTAVAQFTMPVSDTCKTFGIACSIDGSPQQSMLQTIYLANNQKEAELLKWLKSDIPQNQIHGFIGLHFMKQNGFVLSPVENELMNKVQNSSSAIDYCMGCIFSSQHLSSLLTKKNLKLYYTWYIRSHYNRLFR
jgi:hypothetical protein